jgi:hypothetical protein
MRLRWTRATEKSLFTLPGREVVMRCLVPTTVQVIALSRCPSVAATACPGCPADERPPRPCGEATASGGEGTTRTRHALGATPGIVRITYEMFGIPDRLDCLFKSVLVASTGGVVSGAGALQWAYQPAPGDPTWCKVVVSAPASGTAWEYTLHCPG